VSRTKADSGAGIVRAASSLADAAVAIALRFYLVERLRAPAAKPRRDLVRITRMEFGRSCIRASEFLEGVRWRLVCDRIESMLWLKFVAIYFA